jgi:hypothetical protein
MMNFMIPMIKMKFHLKIKLKKSKIWMLKKKNYVVDPFKNKKKYWIKRKQIKS